MSTATLNDLWPDDLEPSVTDPTPAAILRRQGRLLGQKTGNAVYGEVRSTQVGEGSTDLGRPNEFMHGFVLTSGYLRYAREILFVRHGLQPYPAEFVALKPDGSRNRIQSVTVIDAKQLEAVLRETFARDEVKEVIRSLIVQSREADEE